ncbi:MAG TPA: hypothetical protein PK765_00705 [bacterium]|nr:hypothetical protein [bacterium]
MRVWPLEPIDGFPHFERDIAAFFEHRIWRREGMGFSSLELAGVVPITCMLSATERWLTGTFTTTRLPENLREAARDSNLTHVVGMLDILDTHYDKVFSLVGSTTSMRRLTHTII